MRTVGRTSIFELGFHIARLAESAKLMMEENRSGAAMPHRMHSAALTVNGGLHSGSLSWHHHQDYLHQQTMHHL